MGDRGFRASRLRTVSADTRENTTPSGSMRGCRRGGSVRIITNRNGEKIRVENPPRWCIAGRWEKIAESDPTGKLVERNVMTCRFAMNHFPTSKTASESVFSAEGSGPWLTAMESYGSTLDGLVEGHAHQAGEDIQGRFFTGNEDFLPGDDEAYEELEDRVEEATRGMDPTVAEAVRDLVFHGGCRIISVHPDLIEVEEGLARDVIERERTFGEPINRDPRCPCFLHPALAFLPSFKVVEKLVRILIEEEGNLEDPGKILSRLTRNIRNNRGNLKELLADPEEKKAWLSISATIAKTYTRLLK